jgi:hypothetical protein
MSKMYEERNYLAKIDTREVIHNPTGAWIRYDEAYKLTLLNPQILVNDDIPQIKAGAERYLRQVAGLDPNTNFTWIG